MNLYEATKELHHACELHPLGQAMVNGTITRQEWTNWLGALHSIHSVLDTKLPPYAHVSGELMLDLMEMMPLRPFSNSFAISFSHTLTTPERVGGAAYVLLDAHKRGGRFIEKRFKELQIDLPSRHVRFFAEDSSENFLKWLRDKEELEDAAKNTFSTILNIMEEIRPSRH